MPYTLYPLPYTSHPDSKTTTLQRRALYPELELMGDGSEDLAPRWTNCVNTG